MFLALARQRALTAGRSGAPILPALWPAALRQANATPPTLAATLQTTKSSFHQIRTIVSGDCDTNPPCFLQHFPVLLYSSAIRVAASGLGYMQRTRHGSHLLPLSAQMLPQGTFERCKNGLGMLPPCLPGILARRVSPTVNYRKITAAEVFGKPASGCSTWNICGEVVPQASRAMVLSQGDMDAELMPHVQCIRGLQGFDKNGWGMCSTWNIAAIKCRASRYQGLPALVLGGAT